jgi:alpha-galactosidase
VREGVWLRESRGGRPGHDAATQLLVGSAGFGFRTGEVWALHVAWSGNRPVLARAPTSGVVTLGGGEVLLPGESVLGRAESYSTPWVFLVAAEHGMDEVAEQLHAYLRSLPAHPVLPRPVTGNVWEALSPPGDPGRVFAVTVEFGARCSTQW